MSTKWVIGQKLVHSTFGNGVFCDETAAAGTPEFWEGLGWRAVEPPAPVERKLAAGWMKYTPRPNYRECWEIGCSKDAGYAKSIEGFSRMCEEHAGKAGAFAGAPVTETTKCPTVDRRPGYSCDCPTTCAPPPVVEKAQPLTCSNGRCGGTENVLVRVMCDVRGLFCEGCVLAYELDIAAEMAKRSKAPDPKPRPAAHPGVVAQIVGPFVGVWASRGMR